MRTNFNLIAPFAMMILACNLAIGQNQTPEFIESTSPLSGGGKVITRTVPGSSEIQTVTTNSSNGDINRPNQSSNNTGKTNSVLERNSATAPRRESVFRPAPAQSNVGSQANANTRYPYPTNNRPTIFNQRTAPVRTAQAGLMHTPLRASATCTNCQVPYQVPTLGLNNSTTSVARQNYVQPYAQTYAQNQLQGNCCNPPTYNSNYALQVPAYQTPVLQIQPPANQVPSLTVPNPNLGTQVNPGAFQQPQFQTNPQPPFVGTNQFGVQQNSWWTPFVTGSGVYQPIIRIANVKPGTYLGQGIIGQPTAYVDGQPIRNLLRYVFP